MIGKQDKYNARRLKLDRSGRSIIHKKRSQNNAGAAIVKPQAAAIKNEN